MQTGKDKDFTFQIPAWVNWIAADANGSWWGYSVEPLRHDTGWYENEVGRSVWLGEAGSVNWTQSLQAVQRPDGCV